MFLQIAQNNYAVIVYYIKALTSISQTKSPVPLEKLLKLVSIEYDDHRSTFDMYGFIIQQNVLYHNHTR